MNLLALLPSLIQAVPTVVAGVEYLSKEAGSATKEQLALDSLTMLTGTAGVAAPVIASEAGDLNAVLSAIIKLTVQGFHDAGTFIHAKTPQTQAA